MAERYLRGPKYISLDHRKSHYCQDVSFSSTTFYVTFTQALRFPADSEVIWKCKGPRISKITSKTEVLGLALPDFKTY